MKAHILDALARCGRDRVMENEFAKKVAIRWEPMRVPPEEKWIVGNEGSLDASGAKAAGEFADKIEAEGKRLIAWAEFIREALRREE